MKSVLMHHGILAVLHRDVPWLHRHSEYRLNLRQRLKCELIVYQWISCPSPIYRLSTSSSYLQKLGQHLGTPYGGPTFY